MTVDLVVNITIVVLGLPFALEKLSLWESYRESSLLTVSLFTDSQLTVFCKVSVPQFSRYVPHNSRFFS